MLVCYIPNFPVQIGRHDLFLLHITIRHLIVHLKKGAKWLEIGERGELSINSKKEAIGCQFEERLNEPLVIIHPTSLFKKKI